MASVIPTASPPYDGIREGAAELALRRHDFTGERLQRLARKIANDALRLRGATLGDRYDDLVSSLCVDGLRAALRYDDTLPHKRYGKNGGEPFASYLADVMDQRVVDFFRRKSEGFGDQRRGFDRMVDLKDELDPADHDVDFSTMVDDRRRAKWQAAADLSGWDLGEWIVITLDLQASGQIERAAA